MHPASKNVRRLIGIRFVILTNQNGIAGDSKPVTELPTSTTAFTTAVANDNIYLIGGRELGLRVRLTMEATST